MTRLLLFILLVPIADYARTDDPLEQQRLQRLEACMSIPAHEYSTGLLFNPPGYKTYYHRAECLQKLAIDEHDPELCLAVRERKSFFFDGSAVSPAACRASVSERLEEDRRDLEQFLGTTPYRISSLVVRRNGNGKDYDVLLGTAGAYAGRYRFTLSARTPTGEIPVLASSHYLSTNNTLQLFLPAAELEMALGAGWLTQEWRMRGELSLMRDAQNRFWYDRIPRNAASDASEFTIAFDQLAPWVPEPVTR